MKYIFGYGETRINQETAVTNGKLSHLPHFDAKADVAEYIREQKIPACALNAGCFMSNFPGALQKVCDTRTDCSFRTETETRG